MKDTTFPPYEEQLKVIGYMLKKGFSKREIDKIDQLGAKYKLCRDAMLYSVLKSEEQATIDKAP